MVAARVVLAVVSLVAGAACGGDGEESAASSTTSTAGVTTTSAPLPTTVAGSTTGPSSTALAYGSPCRAGSHPDCIDPDGDGDYEYLQGGAKCIETLGAQSGLCADLDHDGRAGYPDSG